MPHVLNCLLDQVYVIISKEMFLIHLTLLQQEHATETEETCTQYNMLKIARYLFRWTGAPAFADYYERAILNGLVGTQRMPADYRSHDAASSPHPADVAAEPDGWCGSTNQRLL